MPTELEKEFHGAMLEIYRRAREEVGYNATRFHQMVNEHGGVEAARILMSASNLSDGYAELWKRKRLDLTVEALVTGDPKWETLFDPEELRIARKRLEDCRKTP